MTKRRTFLIGLGCLTALAGCNSFNHSEKTQAQNKSSPVTTKNSEIITTNWDNAGPHDLLPTSGDQWTMISDENAAYSNLGYESGVLAEYENEAGLNAFVLIVTPVRGLNTTPITEAKEFVSNGWQVVLTKQKWVIAGSTGTERFSTMTAKETPILLDKTPVSKTQEPVVKLLSRSPALSKEYINNRMI